MNRQKDDEHDSGITVAKVRKLLKGVTIGYQPEATEGTSELPLAYISRDIDWEKEWKVPR